MQEKRNSEIFLDYDLDTEWTDDFDEDRRISIPRCYFLKFL